MKMLKKQNMLKIINNSLINLPSPSNLNSWWNFGSIVGLCLMIQIISGMFLSMHYCPNSMMAFNSIIHICRDVNLGWIMRMIHINGASLLFISMYIHISRSLYYGSYMNKKTWMMGTLIFLIMMMTAFIGYVLPWGQMSFWGATVITNMLSTIPYMGNNLMEWVWGGFTINNPTLSRFFSLHFMMPFMISFMSIMHMMLLHEKGSNNPMGTNSNLDKISFHPFFSIKDLMGFMISISILMITILIKPYMFMDSENFMPANPMLTPNHIQPEWYFLYSYAILRSIPNKLGGILALIMSIMILFIMPLYSKKMKSNSFYPLNKIMFWMFIVTVLMLTWLGMQSVKEPFIFTSQIMSTMYFLFFLTLPISTKKWDNIMFKN
uniref:Cytochrome b n=1 Tax=Rhagophthalminae sp. GENSP01 TaxID=1205577 RepID=A0A0S2MNV5_9COLE|nr:cytochrome b [Rhagophthalminae sp. GENSP01]